MAHSNRAITNSNLTDFQDLTDVLMPETGTKQSI